MQEDGKILELIRNKQESEKGFRLLVQVYQERMYWQIRKMVYDHEDANDVMQNTFIKIYKGIDRFKEQSQLYTWIYRIACNEAISFLKKKKRKQSVSIDNDDQGVYQKLKADPYFEGDAYELMFQQALAVLPEKQKLVFNLRYYDDLSYKAISEILGTTEGGLKASYHHAVKKIEAFIKEKV